MKQAHIMVVTQRGVGLWLGRKEEEKEEEKLVCLLRALIYIYIPNTKEAKFLAFFFRPSIFLSVFL
jgi:hypothetical protein